MTLLGITLLSLIPISVKMLILTPAASAEIHSITGTNVNRMDRMMIPTTMAAIKRIELVSMTIYTTSNNLGDFPYDDTGTFHFYNLDFFICFDEASFGDGIDPLIVDEDGARWSEWRFGYAFASDEFQSVGV